MGRHRHQHQYPHPHPHKTSTSESEDERERHRKRRKTSHSTEVVEDGMEKGSDPHDSQEEVPKQQHVKRHGSKRHNDDKSGDPPQDVKKRSKTKQSSRKKRHESSSDSEEEHQRRRRRSRDSSRYDKKKNKHSKHHKHHRNDDDNSNSDESSERERKTLKKYSRRSKSKHKSDTPNKSLLFPMGNVLGKSPETKIDPEKDYFSYHQEFWVYLFREEGTTFNDLDTMQAKKAFSKFAKRYNNGELEEPYYTRKFPPEVLEETKTTKHTWAFKTSEIEREGLTNLQERIRRQTEFGNKDENNRNSVISLHRLEPCKEEAGNKRQTMTSEERLRERRADKRLKESVRTAQEELSGGPKDFQERQIEKKRKNATRMHGASNDKEEEMAGIELSESALFGDDERSSFQSALARERRKKEKRVEQQNNRIQELQSKEEERQKNMLKMLGLDSLQGQKIKIAPRNDGYP